MKLNYTAMKIMIVTDGNNQISLYAAINSYNNLSTPCLVTIRPLGNESVQFASDGATAYSTAYLEHTVGNFTSTNSGSMSTGTIPTVGYT